MNEQFAGWTSTDLVAAALPKLTEDERWRLQQAHAKLMAIDTFSETPAGRRATNYHGEARRELAELLPELRMRYGGDPIVDELVRQLSGD
ncbi:MAG: hypothetical protein JO231_20915 [Acidobacteria bacterium]|nr:hypothetical protein [Acidobacteriota bacterium]